MRLVARILFAGLIVAASAFAVQAAPLASPKLAYKGQLPEGALTYYYIGVLNWSAYPAALFAPAPQLPPCGLNPGSSRLWVRIFNASNGQYIYGFCALTAPVELARLWFATPPAAKPKAVYITIRDRLTGQSVKSNAAPIP